ncbi:MAG: glycosyltransferase family 9 protein [Desulfovibrio sp.]|uniref:glycosyltransferase family 9 protein n=1 Tax=Desulfovibrio sp. 7SRBS1 TaxID=3378064 RepID=UPI003B3F0CB5
MSNDPILVLQMERMGDLILTFPLITWLHKMHPKNEVWVVGEESFFSSMFKISPQAVYFPWTAADRLKTRRYRFVLNLSHREQAARLVGELPEVERYGPAILPDGRRSIVGPWRLYRASIVEGNRYNLLHWADMNAMDVIDAPTFRLTDWPKPRRLGPNDKRIGLFLGASEPEKRPDPAFWAGLVKELLRRDFRPVLFGGPAEVAMGQAVQQGLDAPVLDMCGKLSLEELALFGQSLQLFITPDTGPMHLAAWTGTRVLNLSMGPVNPWETGPFQPGHFVLRSSVSCTGCWRCTRKRLHCHDAFTPQKVGRLAAAIVRKTPQEALATPLPGLRCLLTDRTPQGHYHLRGNGPVSPRLALALFWRTFFGHRLRRWDRDVVVDAWGEYAHNHPELALHFKKQLPLFVRRLHLGIAGSKARLPQNFWAETPQIFRPAASYLQMALENSLYSPASKADAAGWLELLATLP